MQRIAQLESWASGHSKQNEHNTETLATGLALGEAHILVLQRVLFELMRRTDPTFSFETLYQDFYQLKGDEIALKAWMQLHPVDKALAMSAEARRLLEAEQPVVHAQDTGDDTVRVFGGDYGTGAAS